MVVGNISQYHEILLDDLPILDTFLGILDLKTGALIIAAICMFHPMVYGCTLFMPMSYLLLTIWLLLGLFFIGSILLFLALTKNDTSIMNVWIWYSVLFVSSMVLLLLLLAMLYASNKQWIRVAFALLGVLWYLLTVYFIIVVNSHRRAVIQASKINTLQYTTDSSEWRDPPDLKKGTKPSEQQTTTAATEPESGTEPKTTTESLMLLRNGLTATRTGWLRRRGQTESASDRPLLEVFNCSSLAPVGRNSRNQGLSPEIHFSQEDTAKT